MIGHLEGFLTYRDEDLIVIDIGGIGYEVKPSRSLLQELPQGKEKVKIFTHTHVREDNWTVYGFTDREELKSFRLLLRVSGIGPAAALEIVSTLPVEELQRAITEEDLEQLCRVNGIGKKTAQRIVFELRGKLPEPEGAVSVNSGTGELYTALEALGYSRNEVRRAISAMDTHQGDLSELVRKALQILSRD